MYFAPQLGVRKCISGHCRTPCTVLQYPSKTPGPHVGSTTKEERTYETCVFLSRSCIHFSMDVSTLLHLHANKHLHTVPVHSRPKQEIGERNKKKRKCKSFPRSVLPNPGGYTFWLLCWVSWVYSQTLAAYNTLVLKKESTCLNTDSCSFCLRVRSAHTSRVQTPVGARPSLGNVAGNKRRALRNFLPSEFVICSQFQIVDETEI